MSSQIKSVIRRPAKSLKDRYTDDNVLLSEAIDTRAKWVENKVILPNEGIYCSFAQRPYWKAIYNRQFPLWRNAVVIGGRQVEKSTYLANDTAMDLHTPFTTILFILPRLKQAQRFSQERFTATWKLLRSDRPSSAVDQVSMKMFNNGSKIFFEGMYGGGGADPSRGIAANELRVDEAQDVIWDELQKLQETISHKATEDQEKWQSISGTHKTLATPLAHLWADSSRREWFIKCSFCGKWNFPDESILGPMSLICSKCGKIIHTMNGQWVSTGYDTAHYEGFRIPQIIIPNMPFDSATPLSINHKKANMQRNLFLQEVMAYPAEAGGTLLTRDETLAACNDQKMIRPADKKPPGEYFLGLDWGSGAGGDPSFSVVAISRLTPKGLQVVYMKKYLGAESDMRKVLEDVIHLYKVYNIKAMACDEGFGQYQNPLFLERGLKAMRILYTSQKDTITLKNGVYHAARTKLLEMFKRDLVESKFIKLINKDEFMLFLDDFLCLEVVVNERLGTYVYDHPPGTHDDALHATLYSWIPAKKLGLSGGQVVKVY